MSKPIFVIGADVGGTNTDAVVFEKTSRKIIGHAKSPTTKDVVTGIVNAVKLAKPDGFDLKKVSCMSIGTTAFVNAILERFEFANFFHTVRSPKLASVAVLRLCGYSCKAIVPFETFPKNLKEAIGGYWKSCEGGYDFSGKEISCVDKNEIVKACEEIKKKKINNIVIVGVFSPIINKQEVMVKEIVEKEIPGVSVTMSHEISTLGIIERENASILNESLRPLAKFTVKGFYDAFKVLDMDCAFYLTQNDGTMIDAYQAMRFPIRCVSSGPTNSARGAYFLTGIKNAIVVDIGGTTTDIGVIVDGFPRLSQTHVKVGGVRTNFRMPDVISIALGGGSHVKLCEKGESSEGKGVFVGPKSVGYELESKARVWGGDVLTATDIAMLRDSYASPKGEKRVKLGLPKFLTKLQSEIDERTAQCVLTKIDQMMSDGIDQMRSSETDASLPVILVGGGTLLVTDDVAKEKQKHKFIRPKYCDVANALGAAIAQVSGTVDVLVSLGKGKEEREKVLEELKKRVKDKTVSLGGDRDTCEILDMKEMDIGYVGSMTGQKRIVMRCVADISTFIKVEFKDLKVTESTDAANSCVPTSVSSEKENSSVEESDFLRIRKDYKPNFVDGVWVLNEIDLRCVSIGAGILGCGGGGSTFIGEMMAKKYLGKMKIVPWQRMKKDEIGVPIAFMGAPSVIIEKNPSMRELDGALDKMQELLKKDLDETKIVCLEIGGLNSTTPLWVAAKRNQEVIDVDLMGRAFPEFQMTTQFIYGGDYNPVCLSNAKMDVVAKTDSKNLMDVDSTLRKVCFLDYGGVGGIAIPPLGKEFIKDFAVKNSYSEAWRIGKQVLVARSENTDPVEAIVNKVNGKIIYEGVISELKSQKIGGFDKVVMGIKGSGDFEKKNEKMEIIVQNENLVAFIVNEKEKKVVACVPDLISLINPDDGECIQTGELGFGLRVKVLAMPCSGILKTEKALKYVGPEGFKLKDVKYTPCGEIDEYKSVFEEYGISLE